MDTKQIVAYDAVDALVQSGMKLGLGTGSTAIWAVRRVGELLKRGNLRDIVAVPTSSQTELACYEAGIPLCSLNDPRVDGRLDLAIDGADEIDSEGRLTKGGGGALLIEKIVAYASERIAIIADASKRVANLGLGFPVPVEIVREARQSASHAIRALGGEPVLRMAVKKMGAVITDNGNVLLDCRFSSPFDPVAMEQKLSMIPGVCGNGIFAARRFDLFLVSPDGTVQRKRAT